MPGWIPRPSPSRSRLFPPLPSRRCRHADAPDADASRIADAGDCGGHGQGAEQHPEVVARGCIARAGAFGARPGCERTKAESPDPEVVVVDGGARVGARFRPLRLVVDLVRERIEIDLRLD